MKKKRGYNYLQKNFIYKHNNDNVSKNRLKYNEKREIWTTATTTLSYQEIHQNIDQLVYWRKRTALDQEQVRQLRAPPYIQGHCQ